MNYFKSSRQNLFLINDHNFEEHALSLFYFQAKNNPVYNAYISNLEIDLDEVKSIYDIPFMPIDFFKYHSISTTKWNPQIVFESSGTTGQFRSKHSLDDLAFYCRVTEAIFNSVYGSLTDFNIFALLPSYLERNNSSLVAMVRYFIEKSRSSFSGFFLNNHEELLKKMAEAKQNDRKTILIGVSFALMELAERHKPDLSDVIVMETGGMKGRREELTRAELHDFLKTRFSVDQIHSEYGMTELLSQAYATQEGAFHAPPWMKVILRDINDPFDMGSQNKTGGVNIIDLANVQSCGFIETQDLGRKVGNSYFEIIGRFDNSDLRGCNLLAF